MIGAAAALGGVTRMTGMFMFGEVWDATYHVYVYLCTCVHVYMCTCVHVYMYMYMYMYTCTYSHEQSHRTKYYIRERVE